MSLCAPAQIDRIVWRDDLNALGVVIRRDGLTIKSIGSFLSSFASYAYWNLGLGLVERGMDMRARLIKMNLWLHGFAVGGIKRAEAQMAGLV